MLLAEYIDRYYGGVRVSFANHVGKSKQQINNWIAAGYKVCDGELVSSRMKLPDPPQGGQNEKNP